MAAKPHHDFWGWASDHWFLTFLLASSAISLPVYALQAARSPAPVLPPARVSGKNRFPAPGRSPFPGSFT